MSRLSHNNNGWGTIIYRQRQKRHQKVTEHNEIIEFINTEDWESPSVRSSKINRDILVGLRKVRKGNVIRYRKGNAEHTEKPEKTKKLKWW